MAVSSFFGLQTSLRGLIAQQTLLDTAGHNISNASTDGYSRQKVNLAAANALTVSTQGSVNPTGQLGSGVDVTGFARVRDTFLDSQFRAQNTALQQPRALHLQPAAAPHLRLDVGEPGQHGFGVALADRRALGQHELEQAAGGVDLRVQVGEQLGFEHGAHDDCIPL